MTDLTVPPPFQRSRSAPEYHEHFHRVEAGGKGYNNTENSPVKWHPLVLCLAPHITQSSQVHGHSHQTAVW